MSTETLDFACFSAHAAQGPFLVALGAAGLAVLVPTVVAMHAALAEWSAIQLPAEIFHAFPACVICCRPESLNAPEFSEAEPKTPPPILQRSGAS